MARKLNGGSLLMLSVLLGMVSAWLIWRYLTELEAKSKKNWTPVVIAVAEIKPRTTIARSMITTMLYPRQNIAADAVTDLGAVAGRVARERIKPQEPIHTADLVPAGYIFDLSDEIAPGMRAVTIGANEINSVGNTVMPGNYVDVLVSYPDPLLKQEVTVPVLQHVRVLAVDKGVTRRADGHGASTSMTLEILPEEGVLVAVADRAGALRVMLRRVGDAQVIAPNATSSEAILGQRRQEILNALSGTATNRVATAPKSRHISVILGTTARVWSTDD